MTSCLSDSSCLKSSLFESRGVTHSGLHLTAAALHSLPGRRVTGVRCRAASSPCPLCGSGDSCDRGECGRGSGVEGEEERQEVGGKSWSINEA